MSATTSPAPRNAPSFLSLLKRERVWSTTAIYFFLGWMAAIGVGAMTRSGAATVTVIVLTVVGVPIVARLAARGPGPRVPAALIRAIRRGLRMTPDEVMAEFARRDRAVMRRGGLPIVVGMVACASSVYMIFGLGRSDAFAFVGFFVGFVLVVIGIFVVNNGYTCPVCQRAVGGTSARGNPTMKLQAKHCPRCNARLKA